MSSIQRLAFTLIRMLCLCGLALAATLAADVAPGQTLADEVSLQQSSGMAGSTPYSRDRWGLVRSVVANTGDVARTPMLVHTVGPHRHIQFAHRLWLPPRSRRTQLTPVRPLAASRDGRSFAMQSWLVDDTGGRERATPPDEGLLIASDAPWRTGAMLDADDEAVQELVAGVHDAAGADRLVRSLRDTDVPALPAAWRAFDAIVLARTPELDPAQFDAMRQWVLGGGRLWVMLDKVEPHFVQRLLGEAWGVSVVDRAWLNVVTLEAAAGTTHTMRREYGHAMLRIYTPDEMTVTHRVQGYPAAAWQRVGKGRVLVTTLHAAAWLDDAAQAGEAGVEARADVSSPAGELAWFASSPEPERAEADEASVVRDVLAEQMRAQIGHTVISRVPVFVVLLMFAVALLAAGVYLRWRGRLEWVGVAGVVLALLASGVLVGMGKWHQRGRTTMVAVADFVEPGEGQRGAAARGAMGIFRPDGAASRVRLASEADAIAFPRDAGRSSERLRMVWDNLDRWSFPDLGLSAGATRQFHYDRMVTLDESVSTTFRMTARGLEGRVRGLGGRVLHDALIAMPDGHMMVRVDAEGRFAAEMNGRMRDGQFVRAASLGTLTQTQMHRQSAYRAVLGRPDFPEEPVLMGWLATDDEPVVDLSVSAAHRRQQLVVLPLRLAKPRPGQRVRVPAPLMRMTGYRDAPGGIGATVYDPKRREFIPSITQPTAFFMRFQLPDALRTMDVDGAVLALELDAPGWRYEVLRLRGSRVEAVDDGRNPLGRVRVELGPEQALSVHDGDVVVGLRLSPLPGNDGGRGWTLHHMNLSVEGVAR